MIDLYRLYNFRYGNCICCDIYSPVWSMQIRLNPIESFQIKSLSTKFYQIQLNSTKFYSTKSTPTKTNAIDLQHFLRSLTLAILLSNFGKKLTITITHRIRSQQLYTMQNIHFRKSQKFPEI